MRHLVTLVAALVLAAALVDGCSDDSTRSLTPGADQEAAPDEESAPGLVNPGPPSDLATVEFDHGRLTFWPYTGTTLDETATDPINLIFVGHADPAQIRAALLSLNGDRSAFGFPDVYPFNATWSDAVGDVQATYARPDGWTGSEVQLQLGSYDPVRWHLRLFRTGERYGAGGWTVGAAHFEVRIPGTADHQVLSWERAEEIVAADLMRSGLLDASAPAAQTDMINAAPNFRDIPAVIYNGIPEDLKAYIGGPAGSVADPVPIATDGHATLLNVAVPPVLHDATATQSFTLEYGQVVPKPFCSAGPYDFVLVSGPVEFRKTVQVTRRGTLATTASYSGTLTVTPWDVEANAPAGDPYQARVSGRQETLLTTWTHRVFAFDGRRSEPAGGTESQYTWLRAASPGTDSARQTSNCL